MNRSGIGRLRAARYSERAHEAEVRLRRLAGPPIRALQRQLLFARPQRVSSPAGCYWYHTLDLPGIGAVWGEWDLRGRFADYAGGVPLSGKRVLDLGAASGFLTFEAERQGARVVSVDVDHARRCDTLPFHGSLAYTDPEGYARRRQSWYRQVQRGYWLAHRLYRSHARVYYGDTYHLPAWLGQFDVVFVGALLEHLANPVQALAEAGRRAAHTIVLTDIARQDVEPLIEFSGRADRPEQRTIWWRPSIAFYREVLGMLGFSVVSITENSYLRLLAGPHAPPDPQTLFTIVARRPERS